LVFMDDSDDEGGYVSRMDSDHDDWYGQGMVLSCSLLYLCEP
jgi:hypothetical protein